ncbi:glutathione S-transferase family protein [Methylobacterium mesophilicum SR1.6/6]|uniref:Glutathione S-transferase family protein n=1 Tax=Methylobacterium mesophilicum SR1.6/6 TaxID=908290 RepID=A0A6B9FI03_9HYPH|nr:glutathione S-transferase family protein [Methylobacterium mesophilicum]QGY00518.1 glutathione S-transferase family protein [Methylobacterium mesophilicum SR1.6/6]
MIVYGSSVSPYVRKVLVALIEKGIPFEHRPVGFHSSDPGFRAASPLGKIPALEEDGFRLADSSAIIDYVECRHPQPALIPTDAQSLARARWFEKFGECELTRQVLIPFVERFLKPRLFKTEGDEALAQRTVDTALPPLFDYLESQIEGPCLVASTFSIADIAVAAPFHNLRLAKVTVDDARWPKLAAWVSATLERPSFVAAIAAAKA